ncbi:DEAD/DEAH box helicase [Aliikangiella marina]|uniref:DEAD-box ATP-dependent RNA helicase RhpA n=1 Tax=Aliikangiella marina TaxID=1712262 RepID=A0A545TD96_9GAMM|nr:DEAD/DEAH box helicase [Aliikangiella marina]TQV75185.1 DEAD/DEAH box helicase [Aliikangiella marina]
MSFKQLNLIQPIIEAVNKAGYSQPSPIQTQAIPAILAGKDVMAAAQTGTGKTAGFTLPMLQRLSTGEKALANSTRALILVPTRELAAQVAESVQSYAANLPISSFMVFGGVKINPQMMRLRRGVDVLVATPGRLLDLLERRAIKLNKVEFLVLDEADRMLDMGFLPDIKKVINKLPAERQNLLFSATFSEDIKALCHTLLNDPIQISVNPQNSTAKTVKQWAHPVDKKRKSALLSYLIGHHRWQQVLVFVKTRKGANKVAYDLQKSGIQADAIHGDKSQGARTRVLKSFKAKELDVLVATDIAARGLDIEQLPQVINFDLPKVAEDYVHRIGRTGRAGAEGQAISLISADEVDSLQAIENLIRQKLQRRLVDGFEPNHTVPETHLSAKIAKKKPHKKKLAKLKAKQDSSPSSQRGKNSRPKSNSRPSAKKKTSNKPSSKRKNSANKNAAARKNQSRNKTSRAAGTSSRRAT